MKDHLPGRGTSMIIVKFNGEMVVEGKYELAIAEYRQGRLYKMYCMTI